MKLLDANLLTVNIANYINVLFDSYKNNSEIDQLIE